MAEGGGTKPSSFYLTRTMQPTVILKRRVPGLSERKLTEFVSEVCEQIRLAGAVTVLVTSSKEMSVLNGRFRGKPQPTDVLSFPGPTFIEGFAGDIAVSLDIAARNGRAMGHSTSAEVRILVLHGLLHLAGYDHESDRGEMTKLEGRLRRKLLLPAALIERAAAKKGGMRNRRVHSKT
jgi:probable rRNA maturation factor